MHYALQGSYIPSKECGFIVTRYYIPVESPTDVVPEREDIPKDNQNNSNEERYNVLSYSIDYRIILSISLIVVCILFNNNINIHHSYLLLVVIKAGISHSCGKSSKSNGWNNRSLFPLSCRIRRFPSCRI